MRNELQQIERIDQYLNNELSATDKIAFEQELQTNDVLQSQVATQKLLKQAALRKAIKADIAKYGGGAVGFNWTKWLGIAGSLALIIAAFWLLRNNWTTDTQTQNSNQNNVAKGDLSSEGVSPMEKEDTAIQMLDSTVLNTIKPLKKQPTIRYSEDSYCGGLQTWVKPDIQLHTVNPSKGATIEGKEGSLIIVPTNAFVDDKGNLIKENVTLEIVEALNVSDMIAYNLTTMNGENPLQSGGMLYIQPYANGQKVGINPERPLYVEIPTSEYNSDMLAWDGQIDENGNIDWQNPQPLKRYLTKVDFDNLDFLPAGFADAVAAGMPFKNYQKADKKLVDSLYYSLPYTYEFDLPKKKNELIGKVSLDSIYRALNYVTDDVENDTIELNIPKRRFGKKGKIFEFGDLIIKVEDGFKNPVHEAYVAISSDQELDVRYKNPTTDLGFSNFYYGYTDENGYIVFKDIPTKYYSVYAGHFMLKDSIFNYRICNGVQIQKSERYNSLNGPVVLTNKPKGKESEKPEKPVCFIDPLSIKTIQSTEFSNTFLATKEFEKRVKSLHEMPNPQGLFDLYVTNLDKDLSEVDAMVAQKLKGPNKKRFEDFANEKLTNVKDANIYQDKLTHYYNDKLKVFKNEKTAIQNEYSKKTLLELAKFKSALKEEATRFKEGGDRNTNAVNYQFNTPISYNVAVSNAVYSTNWFTPGWKNIDAYLHMLTKGALDKSINTNPEKKLNGKARIYQCINVLKTVIPLTVAGIIAKAKFPKEGTQGAIKMSKTFAVGISKNEGKLMYAYAIYNPYVDYDVKLNWNEITEDELKKELKKLDINEPIMDQIDQHNRIISSQTAISQKQSNIKNEMIALQNKYKDYVARIFIQRAFMLSLEKEAKRCDNEE